MKVEGSAETLGLLKTLYIYFYTILTRVTFLFLNMLDSFVKVQQDTLMLAYGEKFDSFYSSKPFVTACTT